MPFGQTSSTAAADLPALAAGPARLFRRPLVGGALLVGCATTLAGDLALPFRTHRRETAPLFSFARHVNLLTTPPRAAGRARAVPHNRRLTIRRPPSLLDGSEVTLAQRHRVTAICRDGWESMAATSSNDVPEAPAVARRIRAENRAEFTADRRPAQGPVSAADLVYYTEREKAVHTDELTPGVRLGSDAVKTPRTAYRV